MLRCCNVSAIESPLRVSIIRGEISAIAAPAWNQTLCPLVSIIRNECCPRVEEAVANGKNGKKRRWTITIVASVAVVALVIVAVAATRGGTKIDPTKLAQVEGGGITKSVVATGKARPITKVEIKSKASGIVKKLYVDTGDRVKQGQVLAELDRIEIEAQVNSERAQLQSS